MSLVRRTAALVVVASATVAGIVLTHGAGSAPDPAADRAALLRNVGDNPGAFVRDYTRLADMLPNVKDASGGVASDSVVVGRVTAVAEEAGYVILNLPGTGVSGSPGARVTSFDDPSADWRTINITVAVEETLAGAKVSTVHLSWPALGSTAKGQDAAAIGRALQALGRVVIVSKALPAKPEYLGVDREIPDKEAGIIQVAPGGALSLPLAAGTGGEGGSVDTTSFLAGLDTLDELRAQAAEPSRTLAPPA
jgi:hypothetical protein